MLKIFGRFLIGLALFSLIIPGYLSNMDNANADYIDKFSLPLGNHHIPFKGMCAPGFAALSEICVLDDRCGAGAYPGRVCIMDGVMKQYLRPLHQKYAGISVDNIICAEGKEVMFKQHNASPACVNSDSIEKLKHRGWQTEKPVMACTLEWNPMCGMDGNTYGNPCNLRTEHMALKHQGECKVN